MALPARAVDLRVERGTSPALKAIINKALSLTGTKDKEPPPLNSPVYELFQQHRRDIGALGELLAQLAGNVPDLGAAGAPGGAGGRGEDGAPGPPGPPGEDGIDCICIGGGIMISGPYTPIGPFIPFDKEPNGLWDPSAYEEPVRWVMPRWSDGDLSERHLPPETEPGRMHFLYVDGQVPRLYLGDCLGVPPWYPSAWQVACGRFAREPTDGLPGAPSKPGPELEEGVGWQFRPGETPNRDGVERWFVKHSATFYDSASYATNGWTFTYSHSGTVTPGTRLFAGNIAANFVGWVTHADCAITSIAMGRTSVEAGTLIELFKVEPGVGQSSLGTFSYGTATTLVHKTNILINKASTVHATLIGQQCNNPILNLEVRERLADPGAPEPGPEYGDGFDSAFA